MDPLQLAVKWYKIRHAGEQAVYWEIQNKATSSRQICIFFVVDVPVRSLLSSMVDFVPIRISKILEDLKEPRKNSKD